MWRSAAVLLALFSVTTASVARAASLAAGKPAPDFEVTTFDGQKIHLSDLRGQVVILNFWATWCGPCKIELPLLDTYYRARSDAGLRILAVATEDSVPQTYLRPLAKALAFPLVRRISGPYRVLGGVPTNYIIDRSGVLRYAKAAALDLGTMNEILVPLLNEDAPPPDPVAQPTSDRR